MLKASSSMTKWQCIARGGLVETALELGEEERVIERLPSVISGILPSDALGGRSALVSCMVSGSVRLLPSAAVVFPAVNPTHLARRILQVATDPRVIAPDSFADSGASSVAA